jgi:hypothetical protein
VLLLLLQRLLLQPAALEACKQISSSWLRVTASGFRFSTRAGTKERRKSTTVYQWVSESFCKG